MRLLTDEQHASLIYALELIYEGKAQLETVPEALATLAAAPSVEVVAWHIYNEGGSIVTQNSGYVDNSIETVTQLYAIKETP